jgi:hypothetical protein
MMTVDFYRVNVTGGNDFQRLLADVYALPPEERNRTGTSSPIRLQEYTPNGDILEGDMLKIRMDEVPLKASLHGSTRFIDLNDDEGIGEETAFHYYVPWRVLLLQRNRHAVSASAFTWYFNHGGPIIELVPILRSDILQRLARMTIMKKLDVKIAGVENAEIFRGEGHGVGAIIDLKEAFSAPNVSVSVSMGRRRGTLLVDNVRETISGLLRVSGFGDRRLKKLAVEAQEDYTHTPELLDILKSRIIEDTEIDPTADRRLPYDRRKDALREVFTRRRTELRQMFG